MANGKSEELTRICRERGVGHGDGLRIIKKNTHKVKLQQCWRKHGVLGYRKQTGQGGEL